MRYGWRSVLVVAVLAVTALVPAGVGTAAAPRSVVEQQPGSACAAFDQDRLSDCSSGTYSWNIREGGQAAGSIIGTADIAFTLSETVSTRGSRDWRAQYSVYVLNLTGVALNGTTAAVVPECGGGCTAQGGLPDNGGPIAINQTLSGDVSFASPGTSRSTSTQEISIYLFHPAAVGTGTTKGDPRSVLGPVRCDSATPAEGLGALGKPGCVMRNVTPVLNLSDPTWPQGPTPAHNDFVRNAQANPRTVQAGVVGATNPLIRERLSAREQARKRSRVCGRYVAENGNDSCDEYPYSSTRQGVPEFAVTAGVPLDQNRAAGNKLQQFFAYNHVLDGDAFYVNP